MNIDIVNKVVADKNNVKVDRVELINKFYWKKIKNHLYEFDPQPLNIEYVCVIYPNKYYLKKEILKTIAQIRGIRVSPKFKDSSIKKESYIANLEHYLKGLLSIRKYHKYTN